MQVTNNQVLNKKSIELDDNISNSLNSQQTISDSVVELAKGGDKGAMGQIYQCYAPGIYSLLYRMVNQKETAQELMQDSFIDVLKNLSSFRGESGLYAWIRRIAVNRCLMYFRKNKALMVEFNSGSEPVAVDHTEKNIDLEKLLIKLTPKRRLLVWLHEVEGMTHKEISGLMGKSVSFSKVELSRAMQQLKELNTELQTENIFLKKHEVNKINEVALCTPLLNNS